MDMPPSFSGKEGPRDMQHLHGKFSGGKDGKSEGKSMGGKDAGLCGKDGLIGKDGFSGKDGFGGKDGFLRGKDGFIGKDGPLSGKDGGFGGKDGFMGKDGGKDGGKDAGMFRYGKDGPLSEKADINAKSTNPVPAMCLKSAEKSEKLPLSEKADMNPHELGTSLGLGAKEVEEALAAEKYFSARRQLSATQKLEEVERGERAGPSDLSELLLEASLPQDEASPSPPQSRVVVPSEKKQLGLTTQESFQLLRSLLFYTDEAQPTGVSKNTIQYI